MVDLVFLHWSLLILRLCLRYDTFRNDLEIAALQLRWPGHKLQIVTLEFLWQGSDSNLECARRARNCNVTIWSLWPGQRNCNAAISKSLRNVPCRKHTLLPALETGHIGGTTWLPALEAGNIEGTTLLPALATGHIEGTTLPPALETGHIEGATLLPA